MSVINIGGRSVWWEVFSIGVTTPPKSIQITNPLVQRLSVLHPSYIPHLATKSLQGSLLDEFIHLRLTKPHWTGSDCENICISLCNLANHVWMLGIVIVLANIVGFGCAGLVLLFVDLMAIFQQLRASCRCKSVTSVIRAPCRRCPDDTPDGPTVTFQGYAHFGQFGFHRVAFPQPNRLSPHIQICQLIIEFEKYR